MKHSFTINRILIAVENSSYSDRASAYGFEMARKMKAEVAVIHVNNLPTPMPYMSDPLINEPQIMVPELMHIQEDSGKHLVDKIAGSLGEGMKVCTFNKVGDPENEILLTAEEWKADIIILGTHGRKGLDHFLSGSIAESIVRKSKCAVLVVPVGSSE